MKYDEYTKLMISEGRILEQQSFTEKDKLVSIFSCNKGTTNPVVVLQCPSEKIMSICGINLIPRKNRTIKAHTIKLELFNENGSEISLDTPIRIVKKNDNEILRIEILKYKAIRIPHTIQYGIEIGRWSYDSIYIYAINPDINIDKDKTKLNFEIDMWSKRSF